MTSPNGSVEDWAWIIERLDRKLMSRGLISNVGWFVLQDGVDWFHHSGRLAHKSSF